jgi:hypothetical protein
MEDNDPPLAKVVRLVMAQAAQDQASTATEEVNPTDRMLVVVTLLVVAAILSWPKDKPPPAPVAAAYHFGQDLWNRRGWWVN